VIDELRTTLYHNSFKVQGVVVVKVKMIMTMAYSKWYRLSSFGQREVKVPLHYILRLSRECTKRYTVAAGGKLKKGFRAQPASP
jgi:hypothetical protein